MYRGGGERFAASLFYGDYYGGYLRLLAKEAVVRCPKAGTRSRHDKAERKSALMGRSPLWCKKEVTIRLLQGGKVPRAQPGIYCLQDPPLELPMKIFLKAVAALFLLMLAIWAIRSDSGHDGYVSAAPLAEGGDAAWRRSPVWDDGRAEVCAYEVTWAHYGRRYDGRALLVLVKEPWAPDLDVKADSPRPDGFDVLKLNHVRDVPTGVYAYHQMASLYTRRDSGALQKLATASSEACGITTAEMVGGRLTTHSYFDGQGDRAASWPADALAEDGLPASLRDYVAGVGVGGGRGGGGAGGFSFPPSPPTPPSEHPPPPGGGGG